MDNREELIEIMISKLRDAYSAEQQGMRFIKRTAEGLENEVLREILERHIEVSDGQLKRLTRALELLDAKPDRRVCISMQSLIAEVEQEIGDAEGSMLDAMVVISQQKIEHLEVGTYVALESMALAMGDIEMATMMGASLEEEMAAISMLGAVAKGHIIPRIGTKEGERPRQQTNKQPAREERAEQRDREEENEPDRGGAQPRRQPSGRQTR